VRIANRQSGDPVAARSFQFSAIALNSFQRRGLRHSQRKDLKASKQPDPGRRSAVIQPGIDLAFEKTKVAALPYLPERLHFQCPVA
jgi:hypothetical protein